VEWSGVDETSTEAEAKVPVTRPDANGRTTDAVAPTKVSDARSADTWKNWTKKRKIGRLKVTRSIEAKTVWNLTAAWYFAAQTLGLNFNLFVTIRPADIDNLTPLERITYWQRILNKIAQFARDHGYECVLIWSRESDRGTGTNEHLHVLTHIPRGLRAAFERNAAGWYGDAVEIDTRPATYRVRWTRKGARRSAITYITKNSPKAAHGTDRDYRLGGPILGKRVGCSRNIDAAARASHQAREDARRAIHRDLGITISADGQPAPVALRLS
jgi:hypothetical protein